MLRVRVPGAARDLFLPRVRVPGAARDFFSRGFEFQVQQGIFSPAGSSPRCSKGFFLPRVRVPGAARDFFSRGFESQVRRRIFLPGSASSADCLAVSVRPPCAIACINICGHVKNPKHWQPYHCLDTGKYCTH